MAVDERPVEEVALPEAVLGIARKEVVRHSPAEALVPAARIEPQQVVAERFHVRWPEPPDFEADDLFLIAHSILAEWASAFHPAFDMGAAI